jgi:transposase
MLEGGTDSVFFENFIYNMLDKLRRDPSTANKDIVLLMDNAAIHKKSIVFETARRMKANILFNAEYSPWLNPIEQLFNKLKQSLRKMELQPAK